MPVRTVVQRGPKEKKVAAFALDWPGWSRGARSPDSALERLEAYRGRYRPVARLAGLHTEFDAGGPLEVVEDHVGVGSTDFWAISFAPSSYEDERMTEGDLSRRLALLEAAWRFFDEVSARVSADLRRGPRGGGRSRDEIVRHVIGNELADLWKRVGVRAPVEALDAPAAIRGHRDEFVAALRDHNAGEKRVGGRNWTVALLLRHTAFHVLDHAWEMEDRDLSVERDTGRTMPA